MKSVWTAAAMAVVLSVTLFGAQTIPALTPIINFLLSSKAYGASGNYSPVRYPDAGLHEEYVVYYPKNGIRANMPVVLFLEGGGNTPHIDDYRGMLQFLATQGYFVIGAESGGSYDSDYARSIFENALNTAKEAYGLNISKLAVMGHSQGGGQAFYVMNYFQNPQHGGYGSEASLVLSIDGWFAFGMNQADLMQLQGDVSFLQMNGVTGTGTDPRISLSIWNLLHQADKTFLILPQHDHGYVTGSLETLLREKTDLLTLVAALVYDTFYHTNSGYNAIPTEHKSSYSALYNGLHPEDYYHSGDCQGVQYNARENMLKYYDIDYCSVEANIARRMDRHAP